MAINQQSKQTFVDAIVDALTDNNSPQDQIDGITNFATVIVDAMETFVKDGSVTVNHNLTSGTETINIQ